jgi:hypothetical protein
MLSHWLMDPWFTPRLQVTPLQEMVMFLETLVVILLLAGAAWLIFNRRK